MWVFGYGSLIWKVDFPYKQKVKGYIKGFSRRFWQGSEDHRGIPGKPGRVVTIVPSENVEERVWGIAYEIAAEQEQSVRDHLEYREKCGYQLFRVVFHPAEDIQDPFEMEIYVGTMDNPNFLGPANLEDIAAHIFRSSGASGPNTEYLFNLAQAVKEHLPDEHDPHLFELDRLVRDLVRQNNARS